MGTLSLRLPDSLHERVRELAEREGASMNQLIATALAEVLGLNQATILKLERRTDMYLSSLRRFVEAMGGELELTAKFPEGRVRIRLLEDLEQD